MSLFESSDFSEGFIGVAKIAYKRIFLTEFWGTFFVGFFPVVVFLGQGKITPGRNPAVTQSMKIQVKS